MGGGWPTEKDFYNERGLGLRLFNEIQVNLLLQGGAACGGVVLFVER